MIRLSAWPQLSTAAVFVTAVAVVLNPMMPVLPDITVPALLPPAGGSPPRVPARPASPAVAQPVVPALPSLAAPAVDAVAAAALPDPAIRWQPAVPANLPAPVASPVLNEPAVDIIALPNDVPAVLPPGPPATRISGTPIGIAHIGDRPRTPASQQPFFVSAVTGNRPLPAAAVDPSQAPPPDGSLGGETRQRGRPSRPDPTDSRTRGHRGPGAGD